MKTKHLLLVLVGMLMLAISSSCTSTVEDDGGLVVTVRVDTTEIINNIKDPNERMLYREDANVRWHYRSLIENVIRTRLDRAGLSDPVFEWINDNTFVVKLPKFHDREAAKRLLTTEAKVAFHMQLHKTDAHFLKLTLEQLNKETADGTDSISQVLPALHSWDGGIVLASAEPKDTAAINKFIFGERAQQILGNGAKLAWTYKPEKRTRMDEQHNIVSENLLDLIVVEGKPVLTGDVIIDADTDFDQFPSVSLKMNDKGARNWSNITEQAAKNELCIAIVIDDKVYSHPRVNDRIDGGSSSISGNFTEEDAKELCLFLKSGKLMGKPTVINIKEINK